MRPTVPYCASLVNARDMALYRAVRQCIRVEQRDPIRLRKLGVTPRDSTTSLRCARNDGGASSPKTANFPLIAYLKLP
ncbi:MAG: hypothetical protein H0U43_03470 [Chthoniobacterales bacterium]|nr:hypothetical protein [Chthoniobacterales bacterium]